MWKNWQNASNRFEGVKFKTLAQLLLDSSGWTREGQDSYYCWWNLSSIILSPIHLIYENIYNDFLAILREQQTDIFAFSLLLTVNQKLIMLLKNKKHKFF